ncbi:MAG TPA: hypothetical protein PKA64_19920 [Myxococcota bacterium]|nr:hypothetical protein [Myxococcota bacterium]
MTEKPPESPQASTAAKVGVGIFLGVGLGWMLATVVMTALAVGGMFYIMRIMDDIQVDMDDYEADDWEELAPLP